MNRTGNGVASSVAWCGATRSNAACGTPNNVQNEPERVQRNVNGKIKRPRVGKFNKKKNGKVVGRRRAEGQAGR